MKVKIKGNPITPYGSFDHGQILDDLKYPTEFLLHLVNEAGAADLIDYETKIDHDFIAKKKPQSSQSLQQGKALRKKTVKKHKKKHK